MKKGKSYNELLKHPQWQKKRLEVLDRFNFQCCDCGDEEKTLNVHHVYYLPDHKPWDYPDDAFLCLCEDCHKRITDITRKIKDQLSKVIMSNGERILGYLKALELDDDYDEELTFEIDDYETAIGVGDCYHIYEEYLIRRCIDGDKVFNRSSLEAISESFGKKRGYKESKPIHYEMHRQLFEKNKKAASK